MVTCAEFIKKNWATYQKKIYHYYDHCANLITHPPLKFSLMPMVVLAPHAFCVRNWSSVPPST